MFEIYVITNRLNDKRYVGQTCQGIARRWNQHQRDAAKGTDQYLYRAMRKDGLENFYIQTVDTTESSEDAAYLEWMWISALKANNPDSGYVMTEGGDGRRGLSPEVRAKRSKSVRIAMNDPSFKHSKTRDDLNTFQIVLMYISGMSLPQICKELNCSSRTIIKRLDKAGIGRRPVGKSVMTDERREKNRQGRLGKKASPETLEKMKEVTKNRNYTGENNPFFRKDLSNEEILKLYQTGYSTTDIGKILNTNQTTVWKRLKTMGATIRPIHRFKEKGPTSNVARTPRI